MPARKPKHEWCAQQAAEADALRSRHDSEWLAWKKERKKAEEGWKSLRSHVDSSLFVLMKKSQPRRNQGLRVNLCRLAAAFPPLSGLVLCEPPPPYCEALLVIQLFNLRCPAASRGAHIKPRAQQLPIFLSCCQEITKKRKKKKLEACHMLHGLNLLKVSITFDFCQKK